MADLLLTWEDLYTRGHDTPAAELAREHPELAAELAERIKALKATAWFDEPPPDENPADLVPGNTAKPRTLAQRYRLDELIALGGFAEVWRAYDQQLQRAVAIKIPKATRGNSADSLMAEARRVARLRHSGIVPVHDVGLDDDRVFIVSEFMDGGSLADRLAKGRVDQQQVIGWIARIADALDYAHINGVIHRDVKPANILINHHDEALLGDFGIAQSAHKTGTLAPSIGTLRYMAPEQLEGRPVTPSSDVSSLAVVLHESLTGRSPFSSDDPNVIRREITRGISSQVSHQLPDAVAAVCRKALSRNPQERHSSAAHFAADLRRAVAPPIVPLTRSWWPMALAALACMTAGSVWLATRDTSRVRRGPPATAPAHPTKPVESPITIPDVKPITDAVQDLTGPQGVAANIKRMTDAIIRQHDVPTKDLVLVEGGELPEDSDLAGTAVMTFMIAPVETTWGEWRKVWEFGKKNGYRWPTKGSGSASDDPVHSVSWFDALKWCNARSEMEGLSPVYLHEGSTYRSDDHTPTVDPRATGYRLPTEAEWEWAARGGKLSRGFEYSGSDNLNDVGWHDGNSMDAAVKLANIRGTWPVGQKQPNELGLYDMSGNVMEWCWDTNDSPPLRGGGWHVSGSPACRVADRSIHRTPTTVDISIGVRVARNASQP